MRARSLIARSTTSENEYVVHRLTVCLLLIDKCAPHHDSMYSEATMNDSDNDMKVRILEFCKHN